MAKLDGYLDRRPGKHKTVGELAKTIEAHPLSFGPVIWCLSEVVAIKPVAERGRQSLWKPEADVLTQVWAEWKHAKASPGWWKGEAHRW